MNNLLTIRKYFGLTQKQLADLLSVKQNNISQIENGKISLTDRNKHLLVEKLHINLNWLENGIGEITCDEKIALSQLPSKNLSNKADDIIKKTSSRPVGIPFFNIPISNSVIDKVIDFMELSFDYNIDIKPFNDVTLYRPVLGESMSPRFKNSDIVACKRSPYHRNIQFGEAYLCVVKIQKQTFEFLRIIRKHEDDKKIILRPVNENYDDITVFVDDIIELYIIKGLISGC